MSALFKYSAMDFFFLHVRLLRMYSGECLTERVGDV